LGFVHEHLSDFEKALGHHSKAQKVFIAVCGVDSQLVADTKCNIAAVHKWRGKHEEAK